MFLFRYEEVILKLIIIWQGKSERSDWFHLGQDSAIRTVSIETVIGCVFFVFKSRQIKNKLGRVPYTYNKLLTNLASSSRTGEYWPSVVFVDLKLIFPSTALVLG